MARLISQDGFSGSVGGNVIIYGTPQTQVVSIIDVAGTITFDASFNRGGNIIVFSKPASQYDVIRNGSSVIISDTDTQVVMPVGTAANVLQFADGDRALRFDGSFKIGDQAVGSTQGRISASGSAKVTLPQDTSTVASRLLVSSESVSIGGKVSVFGSTASENIQIADAPGNLTFDASFNRGGDVFNLAGRPESYSAKISGSSLVLSDATKSLTIPVGTKATAIEFGNDVRNLIYGNSRVQLGHQAITNADSKLSNYEDNITFRYIPNSFNGVLPYIQTSANLYASVDINSDGYKDIVFAFWTMQSPETFGKNVGDTPTPDKVAIFINRKGEGFVDETSTYLLGNPALGGTARKVELTDINGDGKTDLIFAVNREDGRSGDPWQFNTAFLSAMVSEGDKYKIYNFGDKDWYHSVGYGVFGGRTFAAGAGFTGTSSDQGGFYFKNGNFSEDVAFPFSLSPNTFTFFSSNGSQDTDLLIQTQLFPNLLGVEGWAYSNGSWVSAGKIDNPFEFVKNVTFITYSGDRAEGVPVYKIGDDYMVGGGGFAISESSIIDLNKDGLKSVIMKMELPIVKGFDPLKTILVDQTDGETVVPGMKLIAFTVENGIIKSINLKIDGEIIERNNANILNVQDYNRDGYDDIILSNFSFDGIPLVYLNNRDGSFYIHSADVDNEFAYHNSGAAGLFDDFNNDGILDLITLPTAANDSGKGFSMVDYRYYVASASTSFG
jgi:hypothetical protein